MWSTYPFLRILIPLIVGILLKELFSFYISLIIASALTIISVLIWLQDKLIQYKFRWISGICFFSWFLFAGQIISYKEDIRHRTNWFANELSDTSIIKIISDPVSKSAYSSFEGEIIQIKNKGIWINTTGLVMLYASKTPSQIRKETIIISYARPKKINTSGTFAEYMFRKNIFHKIYLKKGNHTILKQSLETSWINQLRNQILYVIDRNIQDKNANSLSKALLIGFRTDMDKNTLNAFRNTGVIHVISVSGMHLALIYAIFNGLLKIIFNKSISGRRHRILINLLLIWVFSLVCGGSPSVLRSAVMFTFILFGEFFTRKNFTANAIAGSAFCLLSLYPSMLKDLGFLLSYGAVTGLLIYNKPIANFFSPENKILAYGWEVFSTTISAQILTAPVIIFYFGKIPTLFLLTNLIAVPITSILLLMLILLCFVAPLYNLSLLIGKIIEWISNWLMKRMSDLGNLPFSTVAIHFDLTETIFLFIIIFTGTIFISHRKPVFFWLFLSSNLTWSIYVLFIKWVNIH